MPTRVFILYHSFFSGKSFMQWAPGVYQNVQEYACEGVLFNKLNKSHSSMQHLIVSLSICMAAWALSNALSKDLSILKKSMAVFIIFPKSRNTFQYPLSKHICKVANAFRNAFLELLHLSLNSMASTSREEGLVTAQLHCAVWPVEQRSCRAHAFT